MLIIGKGSDPNSDNDATIALDKSVLADLDRQRPADGYPSAQEQAIAAMRLRVETYEAAHGVVDADRQRVRMPF